MSFFRTIGGTAGMSVLGAMLASQVVTYIREELAKLSPEQLVGADVLAGGAIPKLAELPGPIKLVVETAYGHGIGNLFLAATPIALIAIIAIALLPNIPLGTKSNAQRLAEQVAENEQAARLDA